MVIQEGQIDVRTGDDRQCLAAGPGGYCCKETRRPR